MTDRFEQKIQDWYLSPARMVRELFGVEPEPYQEDILEKYRTNQRVAMISNKGSGKTCVLAWLAWNFLLTRPYPKVIATSISGDNLRDGLWSEMAKWRHKSELLLTMFEWTSTRIFNKEKPDVWWMSARTWPKSGTAEDQANTLAGLHDDYIMFMLDETGAMPEAVMSAAENALTGGVKEGHVIQAGNPTNLSGPLYKAHKNRDIWYVVNITGDPDNPKRTKRMPVDFARDLIKLYGRDSNWVKVNVFGEFPTESLNSLIGPEEIYASMKRYYRPFELEGYSRVIAVDIARYGDDQTVFTFREGPQVYPFKTFRGLNGRDGAGLLNREIQRWDPDATFLDGTGGWGTSWEDHLATMGRSPISVAFNAKAHNPRFENKRAEMYWDACEWIRRGGALPHDDDLVRELSSATYTIAEKTGLFTLEPKSLIKAKLNGRSPDKADSFCLSFAEPVAMRRIPSGPARKMSAEYDPFSGLNEGMDRGKSRAYASDYDPFRGA